jgi:octaprenyl-diphosphate synthase
MKSYLEVIEQRLQQLLPQQVDPQWVSMLLSSQENVTDVSVFDAICAPARDLVYSGGKRWRPLFMLLTARMLGGQEAGERALHLVALVELPHNGSLIIDDIEDGADMRRGNPSVHITHGIDSAINAGNFLYYLPTIALDRLDVSPEVRLRLYQIYANYMRKIHLGQGMDITWHNQQNVLPDVASYELMCRLKTGCLAAMGCELGAAVATDDEQVIAQSGAIAETAGLGFQIIDDVLNLEKGNPGKLRGDDIVENKKSLPIILYAEACPDKREELFTTFHLAQRDGYAASEKAILHLIDDIERSGVLAQARSYASGLFDQVTSMTEQLYPPSADRDQFLAMIEGFRQA